MLKLTMRKENLMKVMESISKKNNEWEGLVFTAYIGDVKLLNKKEEASLGDSVELSLKCPDYIKDERILTKEEIFNKYTPVVITKELSDNMSEYYFIVYDSDEEEWNTDYLHEYVEGVNYYDENDSYEIIKYLNSMKIKPF